ncbi:MAG: antirestriction protein ArdA [Acidimicrobiia bacterium]
MNHETPSESAEPRSPERHLDGLAPRIYVASLSDYNAGRLHGTWIDADDEPDDVHGAISDMLAASVEAGAEEYAIHDYEGFGAYQPHEYEPIDTVNKIARGIRDHGAAYAHWANHVGTSDPDALDTFEDHYFGRWDSTIAFVEELLDDFGIERALDDAVPAPWRYYVRVDTEALARDLATDYTVCENGDGVYLFEPC